MSKEGKSVVSFLEEMASYRDQEVQNSARSRADKRWSDTVCCRWK